MENKNTPKWGEIYLADLGRPEGSQQGGVRPVLITSNNINNMKSPTVNYISLTSKSKNNLPVHASFKKGEVEGLYLDTTAMAEQNGTIDKSKLVRKMGAFKPYQMKKITVAFVFQQPFLKFALQDTDIFQSDLFQKVST